MGAAHAAYSFGDVAVFPPAEQLAIQAKLAVGPVDDVYEREADLVAGQVVSKLDTLPTQRQGVPDDEDELVQTKPAISTLQRQAELEEGDETLQMKRSVQRQADGSDDADPNLEAAVNQRRGGGQPLPDTTRQSMEHAFGADFGQVRVHSDAHADVLSRSIQARAFTTSQDIFMRQGEYRPHDRSGRELLAHELTHVVQQLGAASNRSPGTVKRRQARVRESSLAPSIRRAVEKGNKGKFQSAKSNRLKKTFLALLDKITDIGDLRRGAGTIAEEDDLRLDMQGESNNGESLNLQVQIGKESLAGIHLFRTATNLNEVKAAFQSSWDDSFFYNVT